jgi:hypothetical protein
MVFVTMILSIRTSSAGRTMLWSVLLLTLSASVALGEDLNERFYQSIRNDDLVTLRTLVKENGAGQADSRGQTSVMLAAAIKK